MPTVMVENMSVELYQRLQYVADMHQRSLSHEIVTCLEQFLRQQKHTPKTILTRARAVRRKTAHLHLTDDLLLRAKNEGRL